MQTTENDTEAATLGYLVHDARSLGYFDGYGFVVYVCAEGDHSTGPHRPGSHRAKEAMRQHRGAKHAPEVRNR